MTDLEAMFPMLDGALIHDLAVEAGSWQCAVDVLLAVSAVSTGSEASGDARSPAVPVCIGIGDSAQFPELPRRASHATPEHPKSASVAGRGQSQ
eukprot:CAMPEP_0171105702 /NCGR_PEP_ID=MMETSP0766_2-20121228/63259_1 /TAXON_ID=439317 /ORGANISM="Gambierdiscus australes, Strain CAWD 149" /LENGTH=93 /DNA_ID=CAMNT_0011566627 /DNA_START=271 /DNA_END=552 /DNA_ORIENTATION=+